MKLSASQAAKETGRSIPTITRAIKSGKLSAEKQDGGGYLIDASELFRSFPRVTSDSDVTPNMLGRETPIETEVLRVKLEMMEERLREKDTQLSDIKQERDEWRRQATALLADHRPKPQESRQGRSWWSRVFANEK